MRDAVFYDCEMLARAGSMRRNWCGPGDPDPTVFQIGAVRLGLEPDYPILGEFEVIVAPLDRSGQPVPLDPFIVEFTGVTQDRVDREGRPLSEALAAFDRFAAGAPCWSWGADERQMMAISCYVAGIAPPIPATRFQNAAALMLAAGMPLDDIARTSSNGLAAYFGIEVADARAHDGRDDARSIALAVQHLLRAGRLSEADVSGPARATG